MNESMMVAITADLIESGKSVAGGYSKAQLALLGVAWPPVSGWKAQVIGRQITSDAATKFIGGAGGKADSRGKTGDVFGQ